MVALTELMIKARTRQDKLGFITKLNMWGSDLSDVGVLRNLPNLEVLSMSVNKIFSLRDFSFCPRLKELYLRGNLVGSISELRYLAHMRNLRVLTLHENPVTSHPNYRLLAIALSPDLRKLDDQEVTTEERMLAEQLIAEHPVDLDSEDLPVEAEEQGQQQRAGHRSSVSGDGGDSSAQRHHHGSHGHHHHHQHHQHSYHSGGGGAGADARDAPEFEQQHQHHHHHRRHHHADEPIHAAQRGDGYSNGSPSAAAQAPPRAPRGSRSDSAGGSDTQSNVLNSVLLLLQELTPDGRNVARRVLDRLDERDSGLYQ